MRKEVDPYYGRVLVLFSSDSGNASKLFSFLFKANCELLSIGSILFLKSCCAVTDAEIFPLVEPAAVIVAVGTLEVSTARLLWVELVSGSASPCFCVGSWLAIVEIVELGSWLVRLLAVEDWGRERPILASHSIRILVSSFDLLGISNVLIINMKDRSQNICKTLTKIKFLFGRKLKLPFADSKGWQIGGRNCALVPKSEKYFAISSILHFPLTKLVHFWKCNYWPTFPTTCSIQMLLSTKNIFHLHILHSFCKEH